MAGDSHYFDSNPAKQDKLKINNIKTPEKGVK